MSDFILWFSRKSSVLTDNLNLHGGLSCNFHVAQVVAMFLTSFLAPVCMVPSLARLISMTVDRIFVWPKLRCICRRYDSEYNANCKSSGPIGESSRSS